jgi:uridine kinase
MFDSRVIAISGASGSGKSLFTETLKNELLSEGADLLILGEDHYYRDQSHLSIDQREKTNYDHPEAFEHELLKQHIQELKSGSSIQYPQYCFKTHNRLPDKQPKKPASVIIVEGIMLLTCEPLLPLFDIKVYIDTPLDICLLRRIRRDMSERGRNLESVALQYEETVKPMYHRFIQPSRHKADVIVTHGGRNRVALDVIKSHIRSIL